MLAPDPTAFSPATLHSHCTLNPSTLTAVLTASLTAVLTAVITAVLTAVPSYNVEVEMSVLADHACTGQLLFHVSSQRAFPASSCTRDTDYSELSCSFGCSAVHCTFVGVILEPLPGIVTVEMFDGGNLRVYLDLQIDVGLLLCFSSRFRVCSWLLGRRCLQWLAVIM
jgi:hypothetical protein